MYDAKDEANEFVSDDRAGAVAKACEFYAVEEAELKVVDIDEGQVSGLGTRTVVVAMPRALEGRPKPKARGSEREGRSEGGRDRGRGDRDRGERGREGRGDRPRGGDRDRGGRERGRGPREEKSESGPREEKSERGPREEKSERAPREEKSERAPRRESSTVDVKGDVQPHGEFVAGVVERMNVGDFSLTESSEGDFVIYNLSGDGAEDLVAGDGRAVDAIQLLANQAAMRGDDDAPRIVVDVDGAGERREEALERLASRAAKRAIESGRSIALDPMNGRNRRTLHMTIRDMDGVATLSIGEGRYRQVLVVPEGAPEYDDALAASSDS